jgi:hypothetical protein
MNSRQSWRVTDLRSKTGCPSVSSCQHQSAIPALPSPNRASGFLSGNDFRTDISEQKRQTSLDKKRAPKRRFQRRCGTSSDCLPEKASLRRLAPIFAKRGSVFLKGLRGFPQRSSPSPQDFRISARTGGLLLILAPGAGGPKSSYTYILKSSHFQLPLFSLPTILHLLLRPVGHSFIELAHLIGFRRSVAGGVDGFDPIEVVDQRIP